jgi:hypothetical protein
MAIFRHSGSNSARRLAAVQLVDSPAAPFGCIRQHEQVQTGEKLKGERDHRQEAHPVRVLLLCYGDDVDDNGHRKGHGQPAVGLPNPFAPVQCGTSFEDEPDKDRAYLSIHPASGIVAAGTARSSAGKRRYRKLTRFERYGDLSSVDCREINVHRRIAFNDPAPRWPLVVPHPLDSA